MSSTTGTSSFPVVFAHWLLDRLVRVLIPNATPPQCDREEDLAIRIVAATGGLAMSRGTLRPIDLALLRLEVAGEAVRGPRFFHLTARGWARTSTPLSDFDLRRLRSVLAKEASFSGYRDLHRRGFVMFPVGPNALTAIGMAALGKVPHG